MLENVFPADQLRGLAARKSKPDDYKSVRHALVDEEKTEGWIEVKRSKTVTRLKRAKAHDRLLEDRVWMLMYRMGFTYLSGQGGAHQLLAPQESKSPENQLDVVALDDEVAFVIECKSSQRARRFGDFSSDLGKHVALRGNFTKIVKTQFPAAAKRPCVFAFWTSSITASDADRMRAEQAGVPLLDETDLVYYEALVAQIGAAARFQFLADLLQGRPIPGLELTVPAIKTKMGAFTAYTFSASPEYLLKVAFVSHRTRGKASDIDAYQRMLKKGRLKSIRQYISDGGIFPTNIVVNIADQKFVSFDRGKQESDSGSSKFGWLHIRPAYRVAWVIDGQHRLFAYAGHPLAAKSITSVMAFVGLPPSEQARLFVDINAEQRKVKQSLLQELYAELHWDAAEADVRVQAIVSKVILALDHDITSPLCGRVLKADDVRSDQRCISLTSIFRAMEKTGFFIARMKKGEVVEYGPLWNVDNVGTMKRTIRVLSAYLDVIRSEAADLWDRGAGEGGGLAMNEGITICINLLRSILHHLHVVKGLDLLGLDDDELVEVVTPYARYVGQYFSSLTPAQVALFRALRGVQGQTAGTRRIEETLRAKDASFNPPGLSEYLEREKAQTTTRAFEVIRRIERVLQATVVGELKREFGEQEQDWWFPGVPKTVRKKVDDRINEEGGKKGGREENFDLIDYRDIIEANWLLFETALGKGKGSKDARTRWISEVNDLRKPVMHASKGASLPITEEQLASLDEIETWLEGQVAGPDTDS